MKQTALVIATLFATVEASDAKERMNKDINGYLHNGLKFNTKVIKAAYKNEVRIVKAHNEFKDEVRENLAEGHEVMDQYAEAWNYEKSQATFTPPTKANGEWGNIHYNNPQKIMDKWAHAVEDDRELGEHWSEDVNRYGEQIHHSHEILDHKVNKAWEKNGVKAQRFFESAVENAGQAWQEDRVNAPHSLAGVDSMEVREDAHNFAEAVGSAHHAVRQTIRAEHKADAAPDRRIDHANLRYTKERLEIAKGYNKAIEYEIKNTHFERGAPGGEGGLSWSHKQKIVDKWAAPIERSEKAHAQWENTVRRNMQEKMRIHEVAVAEANKVWPAKFAAVEKSWKELAANFNDGPHSLVSGPQRAAIATGLDNMQKTGYELDKSVIDDFLTYSNDTLDQRKQFKSEVKTYVEEKKRINHEYSEAFNYEMENIHFKNDNGRLSFHVDNKDVIQTNWTMVQERDIIASGELKEDWINYQKSIAGEKAAFKATAKAQWPKKFAAYKAAVIDFDKTMEGPAQRAAVTKPHTLITDVQQKEGEMIRGQIYDNMNERAQFKFDVKHDLKAYLENTNGARQALQKDEAAWKAGSKRVQDMYAAAWNYQVAQTKFTPATNEHAAHFELANPAKVSNNYRAAAQADQDLGQEIKNDIANFNKAVAPARGVLKNEINSEWVPQVEKINRSDVAIVEEVLRFPQADAKKEFDAFHQGVKAHTDDIRKPQFTHPYHNLMAVESSSSLSTNEQIAYGTVFLMAMIAVAALSNKGKAESKSVEFDVEDLEMTNKKESKKQIKKTLKDIMKTSNTKVTLMNN